jgi:hypothetical protein
MKANELRIGNFLKYDDEIIQVSNLCKNYVEFYDKEDLLIGDTPKYFQPIELTEELLVKIGFEGEMYEFCLHTEDANITVNLIENRVEISFFGNCEAELCIKYNVKYLHELQNVYYCLTNEELEVNL